MTYGIKCWHTSKVCQTSTLTEEFLMRGTVHVAVNSLKCQCDKCKYFIYNLAGKSLLLL